MIVKNIISSCWQATPGQLTEAGNRLVAILGGAPAGTGVFFRADDVGVPSEKCRLMMASFVRHEVPLHMAVTPAWLTSSRWSTLRGWGGDRDLWCWHQHGWRHVNHQQSGKKSEFGTDRTEVAKGDDLAKGRARLEMIMGDDFRPVFTPPWNRFDRQAGEILLRHGYRVVSRSQGEAMKVPLPGGLPEMPINVDLHTRGETDPAQGLAALLDECEQAVALGHIGFMLHHQRMNDAALAFLDAMLHTLSSSRSSPLSISFPRMDRL